MVHALTLAHSLLAPGGLLLNVHDLPIPHVIEVHAGGKEIKAGWLMDSSDFNDEREALNALSEVVEMGQYVLEDEREFDFKVHADNLAELQDMLAEGWQSAVLPKATIKRVNWILGEASGGTAVVLVVPTRMTRLRAG